MVLDLVMFEVIKLGSKWIEDKIVHSFNNLDERQSTIAKYALSI